MALWIPVTVVPRSSATVAIETFITELSSAIRNWIDHVVRERRANEDIGRLGPLVQDHMGPREERLGAHALVPCARVQIDRASAREQLEPVGAAQLDRPRGSRSVDHRAVRALERHARARPRSRRRRAAGRARATRRARARGRRAGPLPTVFGSSGIGNGDRSTSDASIRSATWARNGRGSIVMRPPVRRADPGEIVDSGGERVAAARARLSRHDAPPPGRRTPGRPRRTRPDPGVSVR